MEELRRSRNDGLQQNSARGSEDHIVRIVKETMASFHGQNTPNGAFASAPKLKDEYAKRQHDEIVRTLSECKGRVGGAEGAAVRLGVSRTTLLSRIKRLGINPYDYL